MQRLWMKSKYVRNDLETKQLDILTHKNCVFSFQYAEDKKKQHIVLYMSIILKSML